MQTVTVSKKYQVVIPEKVRKKAGIKLGDKLVVVMKRGIIHYIAVRPLEETKGFLKGLDTRALRDKESRF